MRKKGAPSFCLFGRMRKKPSRKDAKKIAQESEKKEYSMAEHYLIHLPHSGTAIPPEYRDDYYLTDSELEREIYEYADLYTDELFAPLTERFGGVVNETSRLFFDPERFADDSEEPMAKHGLGWFYEKAITSERPLRDTERKEAIKPFYEAHHRRLSELTARKLERHGLCTLIDCHSFSDRSYWFLDVDFPLPDICIGYDGFHRDDELVEAIESVFEGYEIRYNDPYDGSLVPLEYYKRDERVRSVMIEINKRLYLEEDNRSKSAGFAAVRERIERLGRVLEELSVED
jgi:N-formylglutamate amidohydrolase